MTLARLLALVVLLFAAISPAAARSAGADPAELCANPRQAMATFLDNLQPDLDRPKVATLCFDWSAGPAAAADRETVARDLLRVLDGLGKFVSYAAVPGDADYVDEATGLERVVLFTSLPEVTLEKTRGLWKISATTVAAVPGLYEATFRLGLDRYGKRLPDAVQRKVLGSEIWRWGALVLLLVLAGLVGLASRFPLRLLLRRVVQRFTAVWEDAIEWRVLRWSARAVAGALTLALLPDLGLGVRTNRFLLLVIGGLVSLAAVLVMHALVDLGADAASRRAQETESRMDDALVPLAAKTIKLLLTVGAVLFVLQNLDVDVGSLVAGLGIGGLAVALAAKESLANMFGFVTIIADRPFQIGEWIEVDGVEGTVEEVGIRSTRIRTFYDSLVSIPNARIANALVDNMGHRRYRRFKTSLGFTYGSSATALEALVAGVRASIEASAFTRKGAAEVHLNNLSASSVDVLVYCFFEVDSWTDELRGRQGLILEWMKLAEDLGLDFAFPTQTIHLAGGAPAPAVSLPSPASRQ